MEPNEIWDEICFLVSENLPKDIYAKEFENQVVRAIEKLGWREFTREIKRCPDITFNGNTLAGPDIAIFGPNGELLVVIELRKPTIDLNADEPADQLVTFMLQTKARFGLLIGSAILLYYNCKDGDDDEIVLLGKIEFSRESEVGVRFVSIFERNNFIGLSNKPFIDEMVKEYRQIEQLREILISSETKEKIIAFLRNEFAAFGPHALSAALADLSIQFQSKWTNETADTDFEIEKDSSGGPIRKGILGDTLKMIASYPNGVNLTQLRRVTGLEHRQLSNALFKLKKKGLVTSEDRGVYKTAISKAALISLERLESVITFPRPVSGDLAFGLSSADESDDPHKI